ncbi:carotenoid oxygenase family protein [Sphaerisporangium sp. B11E5]|uniref:carotenoid oxygenase family protein n=1 Tax=Sphaerisporangium sp. B11E5 TaxID=3153563 RepID=UPI00325EA218
MAVTEHAHPWAPAPPRPGGGHHAPAGTGNGEAGADHLAPASAVAGDGAFGVQGVIPGELDGALVRIGVPGRGGRPLVCGIRVAGGVARRLTLADLPWDLPAAEPAAGVRVVARTGRFTVLYDPPVAYSRAADLMGDPLPYRPHGRPARAGLLPRGGGAPRWLDVEPFTRAVNAFDDGGRVVLDVTAATGTRRWTLDPGGAPAAGPPVDGAPAVAAVDPRVAGRRHQMLFGRDAGGGAVLTCDLAAGTRRRRALAPGWGAEEPVFVPRGRAEGDGRLLVPVRDHARRRAAVLVLDALDPAGHPEAVITLPFLPPPAGRVLWVPAGGRRR